MHEQPKVRMTWFDDYGDNIWQVNLNRNEFTEASVEDIPSGGRLEIEAL